MAERPEPPSAQESSPVLEQGGLTVGHWMVVRKRLQDLPSTPNGQDLKLYATAVIEGDVSSTNYNHRLYLGRRHLIRLSQMGTTDSIQVPRTIPIFKKTVQIGNTMMEEAVDFAKHETQKCYTLNDYIDSTKYYIDTFGQPNKSGIFELNDQGKWQYSYAHRYTASHEEEDWDQGHFFPTGRTITTKYENTKEIIAGTEFYGRWLFTEAEFQSFVGDRKSISNSEMITELLNKAFSNHSEYKERLRLRTPDESQIHDEPLFGILEQSIPQAA